MTDPQRVLAAVIERNGTFLIGRRPAHKKHGGLWEFPGGKLEPGETLRDAAVRELREELALKDVEVRRTLLEVMDPQSGYAICFVETLIPEGAEPRPLEHEALAWTSPQELSGYTLAPSDRVFAQALSASDVP